MATFKIACSWEVCGQFEVEADNLEQALKQADKIVNELKLPENPEYVDDSFHIDEGMSKWLNGKE